MKALNQNQIQNVCGGVYGALVLVAGAYIWYEHLGGKEVVDEITQ